MKMFDVLLHWINEPYRKRIRIKSKIKEIKERRKRSKQNTPDKIERIYLTKWHGSHRITIIKGQYLHNRTTKQRKIKQNNKTKSKEQVFIQWNSSDSDISIRR